MATSPVFSRRSDMVPRRNRRAARVMHRRVSYVAAAVHHVFVPAKHLLDFVILDTTAVNKIINKVGVCNTTHTNCQAQALSQLINVPPQLLVPLSGRNLTASKPSPLTPSLCPMDVPLHDVLQQHNSHLHYCDAHQTGSSKQETEFRRRMNAETRRDQNFFTVLV